MQPHKRKHYTLGLGAFSAILMTLPFAAASSTTVTTPLIVTVQAVCLVYEATAQQVQLKCTRNSSPPQDPRPMSGVPDALRLAGPLVVVASGESPDGATLYTYATAKDAVSSTDGLWSVEYF
ncbi:hypothetical protein [Deinococcus irradiatisoli]|uniref:hypothetical protein n=1 Tax=Deinococcus irradiatisoli TaxID=2202254 RepID=UPI0011B22480|nr:hypothetical protein [Deinococcus irradiatisoli]